VQNEFTLIYKKHILQLKLQQRTIVRLRDHLQVYVHLDEIISLWIRKTALSISEVFARQNLHHILYKPAINRP